MPHLRLIQKWGARRSRQCSAWRFHFCRQGWQRKPQLSEAVWGLLPNLEVAVIVSGAAAVKLSFWDLVLHSSSHSNASFPPGAGFTAQFGASLLETISILFLSPPNDYLCFRVKSPVCLSQPEWILLSVTKNPPICWMSQEPLNLNLLPLHHAAVWAIHAARGST